VKKPEAHEAAKLSGAPIERASQLMDEGLWDQELCDPETAVSGSVYLPIGPWAQGAFVHCEGVSS
jgi:hypothetical protein